MADAETTGRVLPSGACADIGTFLTALEAETETDDTKTIQIGGVGGVTSEPSYGPVHVKLVVDGTGADAAAAAADAAANFASVIAAASAALAPGEATSTAAV